MPFLEDSPPAQTWVLIDSVSFVAVPVTIDTVVRTGQGNQPDDIEPGYTDWVTPTLLTPTGGTRLEINVDQQAVASVREVVNNTQVANFYRAYPWTTVDKVEFSLKP